MWCEVNKTIKVCIF